MTEIEKLRARVHGLESTIAANLGMLVSKGATIAKLNKRNTELEAQLAAIKNQEPVACKWRPIETAPKDCTLVLLLLAKDEQLDNCIEGEEDHLPRTIGHNNFENSGEDRWDFAGWDWEQDIYTNGYGTPIAWMPLSAAETGKEQK